MTSVRTYIINTSLYKGVQKSVRYVKQKGLDVMPERILSGEKFIDGIKYIGKNFSSDKQRVALGLTALVTQPYIDAHNKRVDEQTRKVSVAKTIAKIIAGTLTGFFIRYG